MRDVIRGIKISTALLVVLAVVDAALILTLTLRQGSPTAENRDIGYAGGPANVAAQPSSSPWAVSSPSQTAPHRAEWVVDALSPTTAVRARTGGCADGQAAPEVTRDGGQTWTETPTLATSVLRVKFVDESALWFVGTEKDCNADLFSSGNGGDSWQQLATTSRTWHLLPGPESQLHGPGGNVTSPCDDDAPLVDLSGVTTSVGYVLCANGDTHRTADGGATWERKATVPGAWAASFPTTDTGYAAARGHDGCAALAILRTSDSGSAWERTGCVEGVRMDAGIALSFTQDGAGVLVAGESSWWTDDDGQTWATAS